MANRSPKPTFQIRLKGKGLFPEAVPARLLGEIISAAQALANGDESIDSSIRLLKITRGSAKYGVFADSSPNVLANLAKAGEAARRPEGDSLEYYMLTAL